MKKINNAKELGQIVKKIREAKKISQEDLASRLDWKQPVVSRIENGQRKRIGVSEIQSLAHALQIDIQELVLYPYFEQKNTSLFMGDAEKVLKYFESETIDCVVTSPPYYGQRDYGINNQIGLEDTPDQYIEKLLKVFVQIKRILKPGGNLWVNIADTYWSGKGRAHGVDEKQKHRRFERPQDKTGVGGPCVPKQKLLIPHRFAITMQDNGWIVRNDNVWFKPNPTPDPVKDRSSCVHEYVFHFVKQQKYFFDHNAVAVPSNGSRNTKPPPSVWQISANSSGKNHKASFPRELVLLPIRSTCPVDGSILDPFCGSGTVLSVALEESPLRQGIGIDISQEALDEAVSLLS